MLKLKAKFFDEAARSHASKRLIVQIAMFCSIFVVIIVFESIIPSVISLPKMWKEIASDSEIADGTKKLTWKESASVATRVAGRPDVMIPALFSTVFGTLVSMFYCRCVEMRKLCSMGFRKRRALPHYLLGAAIGAAMMSAITFLTVASGAASFSACSNVRWGLIALYGVGFIIQGMSEEVIFRGYFMTTMGGSNPKWAAVLISASAFGLAHIGNPGINPLVMFNLITFGVFAGLYMIYFDDIWGCCGIHTLWNFTQGNIFGISVSGAVDSESAFKTYSDDSSKDFLTGGKFGIEGSVFTTLVLVIGVAVMAYLIREREAKELTEAEKPAEEEKSSEENETEE